MPITDADIRFRASERMTDFADGGGRMSDDVIVDGVDNNVFPDITDIERLTGKVSLRKVWPAVFNADSDTFLSTHVLVDIPPTDAATNVMIFAYGGISTERAEALSFAEIAEWSPLPTGVLMAQGGTPYLWAGSPIDALTDTRTLLVIIGVGIRWVIAASTGAYPVGGATHYRWTLNENLPVRTDTVYAVQSYQITDDQLAYASAIKACSSVPAGELSSGATEIPIGSHVLGRVKSTDESSSYKRVFRPLDALLVHSTQAMAPATVSNSQVVDTTRTGLARLRVVGNNGVEHARFTRGQAAPSGVGCTADLTAGTVTFTDVSGMSQPVTVEHRIEELVLASSVTIAVSGPKLVLNRALSRAFPAGTLVSSLLMIGDLQGRANSGFAQQAWTGEWADGLIGGTPIGDFNDSVNPIACTNAGAVTERWAVIFTNTTAFRVIGETLGEIGTGNTGSDFAVTNPATSSAYFTIPALGWGSGWAAGNVWRFNTVGAQTPVWALRCVAPSVPSGDDSVTLQLRGYINT